MSLHLSHSQVETITDCGEKYRLTRLLHVAETPAYWNVGGRAFHEVAEQFERAEHDDTVPAWSVEDAAERFIDIFNHMLSEAEVKAENDHFLSTGEVPYPGEVQWRAGNRGQEDADWWREHGAGMARAYVLSRDDDQSELVTLPDGRLGLEVEFRVTIAGVPFVGFIDQIRQRPNGRLLIRDLKTGRRTPTSTVQNGEYGVALSILFPNYDYRDMDGDYYMARTAKTTAPIRLVDRHPRADVEYTLAAAWWLKNSGLLLPRPSAFCKSCAVRDFCRYTGGERSKEVEAPSAPHVDVILSTRTETEPEETKT